MQESRVLWTWRKMGVLSMQFPAGMPGAVWDKQPVCVDSVRAFVLQFMGWLPCRPHEQGISVNARQFTRKGGFVDKNPSSGLLSLGRCCTITQMYSTRVSSGSELPVILFILCGSQLWGWVGWPDGTARFPVGARATPVLVWKRTLSKNLNP